MSFTYTPAVPDDVTRCRFHIGDTIEATAWATDEDIQFAIDESGSYQRAVVWLLQNQIARLSASPDFTADWLKVDSSRSISGLRALLAEKRALFGIGAIRSTAKAVYRSDSLQTEAGEDW